MATWSLRSCLLLAGLELTPVPGAAAVLRVPTDYSTIQAAVNAARSGDTVRVAAGTYCGARVRKAVRLLGQNGPVIVGCADGPMLSDGLRAGFLLEDARANSDAGPLRISGFVFDGRRIGNDNVQPLALGILGRVVSDVVVDHDEFFGTVQAITNTGGDRWLIAHNRIHELSLLDCTGSCAGGIGIVIQVAQGGLAVPGGAGVLANRPEHNRIVGNLVEGLVPRGLDAFSMIGILVLSADDTLVEHNTVVLPKERGAAASGEGVRVTHRCCGGYTDLLPGARNTRILGNDGTGSGLSILVEGHAGENTEGLLTIDNPGSQVVPGDDAESPLHFADRPEDNLQPLQ